MRTAGDLARALRRAYEHGEDREARGDLRVRRAATGHPVVGTLPRLPGGWTWAPLARAFGGLQGRGGDIRARLLHLGRRCPVIERL